MDAKQFLAEFGPIVNAPGGVQRVRELVLQLAIQGKIVEQDFTYSSKAELLEIYKQKTKILKKDKFKALFSKLDTSNIDCPFSIPVNWTWCHFDDLAAIARGGSPRPIKSFLTNDPNGLNWIKIGDSNRGSVYIDSVEEKILPEGRKKTREVFPGDLILTNSMSFGFPYILKVNGCVHDGWLVIRTPEVLVDKLFLYYLLLSPYVKGRFSEAASGAVVQNLNSDKVKETTIPLPPLEEQKRIVAKVDELMALCDKLEAQQQKRRKLQTLTRTTALDALANAQSARELKVAWLRVQDHLPLLLDGPEDVESIKQAILNLVFIGKLTEQKEKQLFNIVELMKRQKKLLARAKKIKPDKPVADFSGSDELKVPIPSSWEWCRLNDIASVVRGGSPRPAGDIRFYGGDIPFLKVADVTRSKGMFVEGFKTTITQDGLKKTRLINTRTVLLTNSGATLGVPAICQFKTTFNDGIAAFIHLSDHVFDEYLHFYLHSKTKWFLDIASRGQGQPNLNTDIIRACWFPLPPMSEQKEIVSEVLKLFKYCDQLEKQLTKAQLTAERLSQAAVAAITGTQLKDKETMKAPKTELVTELKLKTIPSKKDQAPLAAILAKHNGELPAKGLWNYSGLTIDGFYQQLKTEMARGWIHEPEKARVVEKTAVPDNLEAL